MSKEIIIDVHNDQVRVAFMEDGELAELYIEGEGNQRIVGNIYRGKVANVLPGMQAAFVDIGLNKNAFLYVGDINTDKSVFDFGDSTSNIEVDLKPPSIRDMIKEGQEITVQVLKEAMGTKGARVTTHITLPGRYAVLMPTVNYVGVSRRIQDERERERLRLICESIKPDTMGLIVRTAAKDKEREDFIPDVEFLFKLWSNIKQMEEKGDVPRLLYKDQSLIYRTVRDLFTREVDLFIINDEKQYYNVLELLDFLAPNIKKRVKLFDKDTSIFEYYGIEHRIEKAIQKKVWLRNGGYIVIDATEALTVIDVNTGKFVGGSNLQDTVVKTNMEAAEEIARQIRLRDIGGIIIIDFIDMDGEENKQKVLDALQEVLKKDRTKTNVLGFTGLGLVEMTRKRVRDRLSATLLRPCPYCNGTGKVYSESMLIAKAEKELERVFKDDDVWGVRVEMHPRVAKLWMEEDGKPLDILEKTFNKKIYLITNENLHLEEINISIISGPEELEALYLSGDRIEKNNIDN